MFKWLENRRKSADTVVISKHFHLDCAPQKIYTTCLKYMDRNSYYSSCHADVLYRLCHNLGHLTLSDVYDSSATLLDKNSSKRKHFLIGFPSPADINF